MGLYKDIMKHANDTVLFADELCPFYICSIGAHVANIKQQEKPFYFCKGIPEKINVSVANVAPPGLAKSYAMKFFNDKQYGINPFHAVFRGKITEAGFVGTNSEGEYVPGDAADYSDGFLCFNEMSNILIASESKHSGELINQVLEALSEGHVSKRLGSGVITVPTNVTIWGATQPVRSDSRAGLGRRFMWINKIWTPSNILALKEWRRSDKTIAFDKGLVKKFRQRLNNVQVRFAVEEVEFDPKFFDLLLRKSDTHTVLQKMEHLFIGKEVMDNYDKQHLSITGTKENKKLLEYVLHNYENISFGGELSLVISTLTGMCGDLGVPGATRTMLWGHFRKLGYAYDQFGAALKMAMDCKAVKTYTATATTTHFHKGNKLYYIPKE